MWAIYCESNMDLSWSNSYGWTDAPDFDLFTDAERELMHLPIGGVWRRIG